MASRADDLIQRLEVRQASIPDYKATWCPSCFRCSLSDPKVRGDFVLLDAGDENCRQTIHTGTISECLASFRQRDAA